MSIEFSAGIHRLMKRILPFESYRHVNARLIAAILSLASLGLQYASADNALFEKGIESFRMTLPDGSDPFEWNTKANIDSPHYQQAFDYLREAAEQGNPDAQYLCAIDHRYGQSGQRGSQRNPWLARAADAGSPHAQYQLSRALYLGLYGERKDSDLSLDYLARAAEQGHAKAIAELERRQSLMGFDRAPTPPDRRRENPPPIVEKTSIAPPINAGPDVLLFEHAAMDGEAIGFFAGNEIPNLEDVGFRNQDWNDEITSIEVRGNVDVYLFEHAYYQGRSIIVSESTTNLSSALSLSGRHENWNDRVSSLRIESRSDSPPPIGPHPGSFVAASAYSDAYFTGSALELRSGESYPNLKDMIRGRRDWNDAISSIELAEGYVLELHTDANFEGEVILIDSSQNNMDRVRTSKGRVLRWNDAISSIRVLRR